jgi:hypothetical protein
MYIFLSARSHHCRGSLINYQNPDYGNKPPTHRTHRTHRTSLFAADAMISRNSKKGPKGFLLVLLQYKIIKFAQTVTVTVTVTYDIRENLGMIADAMVTDVIHTSFLIPYFPSFLTVIFSINTTLFPS